MNQKVLGHSATVYAQGDRVYSDKKIYEALGAGTSYNSTYSYWCPASDGVINWVFIDDAVSLH